MKKQSFDTDVLIVGAGPTGLTTACQLERFGVDFKIIDKKTSIERLSKALNLHIRTQEIFEGLGIMKTLRKRAQNAEKLVFSIGNHPLREVNLVDKKKASPYPMVLLIEQHITEQTLFEKLQMSGKGVSWGTELIGLSQDKEGVTAQVIKPDGTKQWIRAKYVIGADGARSKTRKLTCCEFDGNTYHTTLSLVDVYAKGSYKKGAVNVFIQKSGLLMLMPLPGKNKVRLIAPVPRGEFGNKPPKTLTYKDLKPVYQRLLGNKVRLSHPQWFSVYKAHKRMVDEFKMGRVFLAGDSAHIHSPTVGQGMNLSIQDGWNLAWKLGMVLKYDAQEMILDSYHVERSKIAKEVLKTTDRVFGIMGANKRILKLLRYHVMNHLTRKFLGTEKIALFFLEKFSQIRHSYPKSPLNGPEKNITVFGESVARPGFRVPNANFTIKGKRKNIFQLLDEPKFFALILHGSAHRKPARDTARKIEALNNRYGDIIKTIEIPYSVENLEGFEKYGAHYPSIFLIRPDGYMCLRSQPADTQDIKMYFKAFFGKYPSKTSLSIPQQLNGLKDISEILEANFPGKIRV